MTDVRVIARDRRDTLGEGVTWSARDGAVYWVDILGRRVNRLHLADERVDSWAMPDVTGWVIERERGGFVAGVGRSVMALELDPFAVHPFAELPDEPDDNRVNDAAADPTGRIVLGTMPFDCARPTGSLYRLHHDARIELLDTGYVIANGPAIHASGAWMLHTDTAKRSIYRYPIAPDGAVGPATEWLRFEPEWGAPDGMTFDADGGLWVACWGGSCVRRFEADGRFDRRIDLPASQITNLTFAGPALDEMFVSSAADGVDEEHGGALFEVDPGCRGQPPHMFKG